MLPSSHRMRERRLRSAPSRSTGIGAVPRTIWQCLRPLLTKMMPQRIWNERYEIGRRQDVERYAEEDLDAEAPGCRAEHRAPEFLAWPHQAGPGRDQEAQVLDAWRQAGAGGAAGLRAEARPCRRARARRAGSAQGAAAPAGTFRHGAERIV